MRPAAPLIAVAALVACTTGSPVGPEASGSVTVCEPPIAAPVGWRVLPAFRERYADRIGVRVGFRDGLGRELHVFAGIPGEFGEGLPAGGDVVLAAGRVARLSGSGAIWVLEWEEGGTCDPRAALGNGFEREGFLEALEDAGVAAGPG